MKNELPMTYKSDDTLRRIANQENVFVGEHAFDLKLKSDQLTTELFYKDTQVSISHVVAGYNHAAVLRVDGRVIVWGGDDELQSTVPVGFANIQQIAAGYFQGIVHCILRYCRLNRMSIAHSHAYI